jgi:hypothetical protein
MTVAHFLDERTLRRERQRAASLSRAMPRDEREVVVRC